jgi:hypothetical protein
VQWKCWPTRLSQGPAEAMKAPLPCLCPARISSKVQLLPMQIVTYDMRVLVSTLMYAARSGLQREVGNLMLLRACALLLLNLLLLLPHPEEHSPPCPSQSQDQQKLC